MKQLRQMHKNRPLFHLKAYLSKAGPGRTIQYVAGKQVLFEQGKRSHAVFYILTGVVKLTIASQGKEITLCFLGPGGFAGKESIASAWPTRRASASALTNCTLLRIERKEMLRVIQEEKAFATFFLEHLLARIGSYQELMLGQLLHSSDKRLAQALLQLVNFGNGGNQAAVVPKIHQGELAEVVGTTRSRVNLFMNRFRKLGFIAYQGRGAVTIHTAKLSKFVMA